MYGGVANYVPSGNPGEEKAICSSWTPSQGGKCWVLTEATCLTLEAAWVTVLPMGCAVITTFVEWGYRRLHHQQDESL